MLVFRDQHLGAGEIAAFGRRFGTPRIHSLVGYRHEEHPEVSWLRNVDDGRQHRLVRRQARDRLAYQLDL